MMIWTKTDLIITIDYHTSTTKGLLSNILTSIDKVQKRTYYNN